MASGLLFDVGSLEFSGGSLPRLYALGRWRSAIARMSNLQEDLNVIREWRLDANVAVSSTDSRMFYLLFDAYSIIGEDVSRMVSSPIDVSGIDTWFRLVEMGAMACRIVTFPSFRADVWDAWSYVNSVATLVGVCAAVVDGYDVRSLAHASPLDVSRLAGQVALDFVCGRGSVWVAYATDMFRLACMGLGRDPKAVWDMLANVRLEAYVKFVAQASGSSVSDSGKSLGRDALDMCLAFDGWQSRCYRRSRVDWFDFSEEVVRECMDGSVAERHAEALVPRSDATELFGWSFEFACNPVDSLFTFPSKVAGSLRPMFVRSRMYEITRRRMASKSMFIGV